MLRVSYLFVCVNVFETTESKPKSVFPVALLSSFPHPWLHVLSQVFGPATRLQRNDIRYLPSLNEIFILVYILSLSKNTIRDGGSTALLTACSPFHTAYTVYIFLFLYFLFPIYI